MPNIKNIVQLDYGLLLINIAILFNFILVCSKNQRIIKNNQICISTSEM